VGTTTLATALRGYDRGREVARGVDLLACRGTGQSLQQAAVLITWLAANGRPRPVLAVSADQPGPVRGTTRARLRMIEPQVAALVVLPYVPHWRELTDPLGEAVRLSQEPADQLPKQLRDYADALAELARKVVASGLLRHPADATGPISRTTATGPIRTTTTGPIPATATGPIRTTATGPVRVTPAATPDPTEPTGPEAAGDDLDFLSVPLARTPAYGGAR
jgi:hypothetical protein